MGNSAYILASLHDSPNSLTSINQGIVVRTANGGPIKAGQPNQLVLSSGTANVPLKGALLYAQDKPVYGKAASRTRAAPILSYRSKDVAGIRRDKFQE